MRTLQTALSTGKLAHAYLFSGPRGSGKTSAAKILARCIDCVLGPTPEPDNTCENCRAILAGTALDVVEVDAASNRGIEEIRALRESVKFAPASMRMKVFIIDEAHMLTREGANAFLRTLEEPPAHAVFILATTAPEALPPTILSRCQRYAFRRIAIPTMIARMREIADAEGIAIDDGALGAIAYRADGGLRDALTMLEQVASYAGGPVEAATVEAAFGATGRQYARALVDAILGSHAAAALRIVDEASDAGADMLGLIRGAIGEYRNLLVARIDPELLSRDLSANDAEAVVTLAGETAQPKVVRGLRLLADALAAGRSSGNPRLELETALLRLVVQTEDPSLDALATRVALLEAGTASAPPPQREPPPPPASRPPPPPTLPQPPAQTSPQPPAQTSQPQTAQTSPRPQPPSSAEPRANHFTPSTPSSAPAKNPAARGAAANAMDSRNPTQSGAREQDDSFANPASLQQIRSQWDRIRLRVEERYKPMRGVLAQATVDALEGGTLSIGVVDALQESIMRERTALVESAIADVVGTPLRVRFKTRAAGGTRAARSTHGEDTGADASANGSDGEVDLLAYARKKLGGTETR